MIRDLPNSTPRRPIGSDIAYRGDLGSHRARDPERLRVQEVAPGHIFCCLMLGNESEPARNENLGHSIAYHNRQYKSPSCFVLRRAMSSEGLSWRWLLGPVEHLSTLF